MSEMKFPWESGAAIASFRKEGAHFCLIEHDGTVKFTGGADKQTLWDWAVNGKSNDVPAAALSWASIALLLVEEREKNERLRAENERLAEIAARDSMQIFDYKELQRLTDLEKAGKIGAAA
jgi:hypothetical protein